MEKPAGKAVDISQLDMLAGKVKSGARAFLVEEYKYLGVFVFVLAVVLFGLYMAEPVSTEDDTDGVRIAFAFILGALLSGGAGWLGMMVATDGNVRTTVACAKGTLNDGLQAAFTAGAVMGFTVVGLGLFGLGVIFAILQAGRAPPETMQLLSGFGFGASSIALFARVAGGIYTKAASP